MSTLCESCGEAIPPARLHAVPGAIQCVPCLEDVGDVRRIRRYDEPVGPKGEDFVEHYFQSNQYLEQQIKRLNGPLHMEHEEVGPIARRTTVAVPALRLADVVDNDVGSLRIDKAA